MWQNRIEIVKDVADERLAYFRLWLRRDHTAFSKINGVLAKKLCLCCETQGMPLHKTIHVGLTTTIVKRALRGHHEVLALLVTRGIYKELEHAIGKRRVAGGVYVIDEDVDSGRFYEELTGLTGVNASQRCAVVVHFTRASRLVITDDRKPSTPLAHPPSPPQPLPPTEGYQFWEEGCPIGLDVRSGPQELQCPILIFDDVTSSENVGGIMRTCFSLGITNLMLTPISYAALTTRSIRSSMGAAFFMRFYVTKDLPASIHDLRQRGVQVLATTPRGSIAVSEAAKALKSPVMDTSKLTAPSRPWALVCGNELNGSSEKVLAASTYLVRLPQIHGDSFSVGVATGMALYELLRDDLIATGATAPNASGLNFDADEFDQGTISSAV